MNNEEKAREISKRQRGFEPIDIQPCSFCAALEMAEWKDEQTRQYLNDCIKKAHAVNSPNMVKLLEKMKSDLNL